MTPRVTSTGVLYFALGSVSLAAFAMSFQALMDLAKANEMKLSWAFPCIIDLAAIACAVASYQASVSGRDDFGYRALVVTFTLLSAVLNVAQVWRGPDVAHCLKYIIHALPPLVSFAIFEVLLSEVRHASAPTVDNVTPEPVTQSALPGGHGDHPPRDNVTPRKSRRAKRQRVTGIAEMAKREGVSIRTMYRRMAKQ